MQSIGIDFFQRHKAHYLLLMNPFSGLPMFQKMKRMTAEEVTAQLKNWFFTFGVARLIRADNDPPFSSGEFKAFWDKATVKTEMEGTSFEEAFAMFNNTRNTSRDGKNTGGTGQISTAQVESWGLCDRPGSEDQGVDPWRDGGGEHCSWRQINVCQVQKEQEQDVQQNVKKDTADEFRYDKE